MKCIHEFQVTDNKEVKLYQQQSNQCKKCTVKDVPLWKPLITENWGLPLIDLLFPMFILWKAHNKQIFSSNRETNISEMNGRNKQWMNQNMIFKYEKKANKYYHHTLNLYHKLGIKTYVVQWMFTGTYSSKHLVPNLQLILAKFHRTLYISCQQSKKKNILL